LGGAIATGLCLRRTVLGVALAQRGGAADRKGDESIAGR